MKRNLLKICLVTFLMSPKAWATLPSIEEMRGELLHYVTSQFEGVKNHHHEFFHQQMEDSLESYDSEQAAFVKEMSLKKKEKLEKTFDMQKKKFETMLSKASARDVHLIYEFYLTPDNQAILQKLQEVEVGQKVHSLMEDAMIRIYEKKGFPKMKIRDLPPTLKQLTYVHHYKSRATVLCEHWAKESGNLGRHFVDALIQEKQCVSYLVSKEALIVQETLTEQELHTFVTYNSHPAIEAFNLLIRNALQSFAK